MWLQCVGGHSNQFPSALTRVICDQTFTRVIAANITSDVAGDLSSTGWPAPPNAATASRIASRTEMASINGGSPLPPVDNLPSPPMPDSVAT